MASTNYWTENRIRAIRLHAGFLRCHDIVKEFVEIKLSEALGFPRADFPSTWKRWCHDNIAYVKRFPFWKRQSKEEDEGEEIPVFEKGDITFFAFIMKKIVPDCPGLDRIRKFRNTLAHDPRTEIEEQLDFEEQFRQIEDAVDELFHEDTLQEERKKWRQVLIDIRLDDINKIEPLTKNFACEAQAVIENNTVLQAGRDIINVGNIGRDNIHSGRDINLVSNQVIQNNIFIVENGEANEIG